MFKNVLIGVDGRPGGRDAIALASRLTDPAGKLTLAHVHSGALRLSHAISPALVRAERQASVALLEQERTSGEASAEIVSVEAMSPGGGLHQQGEDQGADLLVVGSCSHGSLGRVMLGDDTRAALNGAPCAVAIAPHGFAEHPTQIANVGVAYNGSPESAAALAQARDIAAATGATIHALEVVSIPSVAYTGLVASAIGETIDAMLQEARSRMRAIPDVYARAVYGLAGEELASFSDALDLLIVGSHGYGLVKRLVLGSTSDYLQRHARCSLLVLPRSIAPAGSRADDVGASAVAVV
ncbi:MAG TPA: universal stress protein [Solirubrobacteraceae bacterium]|jgi:nucleotide-binding universal stress UspA family protein|nr:universal stress protein [Solirubrobacteraceae bacterium]